MENCSYHFYHFYHFLVLWCKKNINFNKFSIPKEWKQNVEENYQENAVYIWVHLLIEIIPVLWTLQLNILSFSDSIRKMLWENKETYIQDR